MKVQVLTDSTSYLPLDLVEEYDIKRVTLSVSFGAENIKELEITNEEFYPMMKKLGIPVSSQPSVNEIYDEMIKVVETGDSLCCVFLSSDMSGTYDTSKMAKEMVLEEYEDAQIEIIDSRSNSMQLGFAVLQAARESKAGKSLEQVKNAALENIKRSRFLFIPDNLDYLKKGGRIGGASALIGNIFKIIPILTVEDGKTAILTKARTKKNAVSAMINKFMDDINKFGLGEVIIHHINCLAEAQELANQIKEKLDIKISTVDIGPIIGLHVGPGAIGIAYYTQEPLR
ncbi:MAG: DegV family protein [Syntrophomonadaceae bacterium]|nr:DegV family protein [Syntrophomonadaceae bacterium]